jgi:hypothetical protein
MINWLDINRRFTSLACTIHPKKAHRFVIPANEESLPALTYITAHRIPWSLYAFGSLYVCTKYIFNFNVTSVKHGICQHTLQINWGPLSTQPPLTNIQRNVPHCYRLLVPPTHLCSNAKVHINAILLRLSFIILKSLRPGNTSTYHQDNTV